MEKLEIQYQERSRSRKKRLLAVGITLLVVLCLGTGAFGERYDGGDDPNFAPMSENSENNDNSESTEQTSVTWSLDDNGVLIISGSGDMQELYSYNYPWSNETIRQVVVQAGVTSVGKYAFSNQSELTSVSLADTVTSIGESAFNQCRTLQSVMMPTSLTYLGNAAFSGCNALKTITLPDGITDMGYQTFESGMIIYASIGSDTAKTLGQKDLSFRAPGMKYDLQYELSYNYDEGEYNISGLKIKNISSTVTSFKVPEGVTLITSDTFAECKNLKELILPDSVDTIRYNALSNCTKLKTLTLPDNISSIGYGAFPSSIILYAKIGSTTAKELGNISCSFRTEGSTCDLIYRSDSDDTSQLLMLEGIDNSKKSVIVPDGVEGIRAGALYSNAESSYYPTKPIKLETLTLPDSIKFLSLSSFAGVGKNFYVKVEKGSYAESFAKSHGLQYDNGSRKVIGTGITSVDEKVNWIVSNYVTSDMSEREKARVLHDWLIMNAHYDLTYSTYNANGVLINGSGVCDSYSKAFELLATKAGLANRRLTGTSSNGGGHSWNLVRIDGQWYHLDVTWDDPVHSVTAKSISNEPVVSGMERTRYFLVSDSGIGHHWSGKITADNNQVTGYHDNGMAYHYAKEGNYHINTTTGKATLVLGKSSVTKVTIPDTITENGVDYQVVAIAAEAYMNNTKLLSVSVGKNVTSIGKNAFAGCTKLSSITLGNGVKTIGNGAFTGCTKLTEVTIGKKVSTIGDYAFSGCSKLKTLTIGAAVTTIGAEAFSGCKALTKVTVPEKVKKIGKKAFYGCKKLKTIEIKTTKLTSKNVGADAFNSISSKATIQVPSQKLKSYKKILLKKGVPETVTFQINRN